MVCDPVVTLTFLAKPILLAVDQEIFGEVLAWKPSAAESEVMHFVIDRDSGGSR